MPLLNNEQKNWLLQQQQLDPTQWSVTDDGSMFVKRVSNPEFSTLEMPEPPTSAPSVQVAPQSTALEAGVKSFIDAAPATAGAAVSGAAALAGLGGTGLSMTGAGALVGIPLMLGAAYLGGKGVRSLQTAVEPEEYKQNLARIQAEHPIASEVGGLATLPLGGFNPNPANIARAGSGLAKIVGNLGARKVTATPEELVQLIAKFGPEKGSKMAANLGPKIAATPEEIGHLLNVSSGAVIGGVQPLIEGITDPVEIAKNVAIGALFNDPNKLGQRMGFHAPANRDVLNPAKVAALMTPTKADAANLPLDYNTPAAVTGIEGMPLQRIPRQRERDFPAARAEADAQNKAKAELAAKVKLANELHEALTAGISRPQGEVGRSPFSRDQRTAAENLRASPEDLEMRNLENKMAGRPAEKYQKIEGTIRGLAIGETNPHDVKKPEVVVPEKKAITVEAAEAPFAPQPVLTPAGKALMEQVLEMKKKPAFKNLDVTRITPRMFNAWAEQVSTAHGITDTAVPSLTDAAGNAVKGAAKDTTPETSINMNAADAGTPAHETTHHIFDSMPKEIQDEFKAATLKDFEKYNAQRIAAGKEPFTHDEFIATEAGYKTVLHLLNTAGETPIKRWWNDTKAIFKKAYGKNATAEDLYRAHIYDMVKAGNSNVRAFKGGVGKAAGTAGVKNQEVDRNIEKNAAFKKQLSLFSDKQLAEGQQEYLKQGQKALVEGRLQDASELITKAQFHREELQNRNDEVPTVKAAGAEKAYREVMAREGQPARKKLSPDSPVAKEGFKSIYGEVKQQPANEGLKSGPKPKTETSHGTKLTYETLRQRERERRVRLAQERAAIMAKQKRTSPVQDEATGVRKQGASPVTWEHRRGQLVGELTSNTKDKEGNVIKEGELEQIRKIVNTVAYRVSEGVENKQPKQNTPYPNKDERHDIFTKVVQDIQNNGVDSDGIMKTAARRARAHMDELIKRRKTEPRVVTSLDAAKGKNEDTSLHSVIADKRTAQDVEQGTGGEDTTVAENLASSSEAASAEDLQGLEKHFEEKKGETVAPEIIQDRRVSAREASKKVHTELADELHWKLEEGLSAAKDRVEAMIEDRDMNVAEAAALRAKINEKIKRAEPVLNELKKHFGKEVDVNEWTRKIEGGQKFQRADEGLQPTGDPHQPERNSFLRSFEATFDRVEGIDKGLAQAFRNWSKRKDQYVGIGNVALDALDKYKRADVNAVVEQMREAFRSDNHKPLQLSGKDQEIYDILSGYYGKIADVRRDLGMEINHREAGKSQNYVPDQLSEKAIDQFVNHPTSTQTEQMKRDWIDHILKQDKEADPQEVTDNINNYIRALGGGDNNYLSVKYGAIRKAQGYGLPESIREADGVRSLERYTRRAANDLAMYQELESKKPIAAKLELYDPKTGVTVKEPDIEGVSESPLVRDAMKWVTGNFQGSAKSSPIQSAIVRLVNNSLLGPATGLRDTASVPLNMIPYISKVSDLGAVMSGIAKIRENSQAALRTAARQPNVDRLQFDAIKESPNRYANMIRKAATVMRTIQGREAIENFNRDLTFSIGKELGRQWIIGAQAGDKKAAYMLKKFDTLLPENVLELSGEELEKAIDQIGKNFTDRNQGTYGGEGLPTGIIESQFAPFLALQKWSIEKTNTIYKDVMKPFMSGENRLPMLTYTLGAILTGAGIQELNKLLTNKKSQDPTIKEVLAHGRPQDYVAQLATIMQLAAYGGIMSDGLKFLSDVGIYGKTPRNIVSFPTASAALDTQERITDYVEAMRSGEDPWEVTKKFTMDMMTRNIQAARMIAARTANEQNNERGDKFRDYRVFQQIEGAPAKTYAAPNPYLGMAARRFKQEDTMGEAAAEAPDLIKRTVANSKDYLDMKDNLANLKRNSYQTMPNIENMPVQFGRYYKYLQQTQGEEVAQERVRDFMKQATLNKMKSKLIPSI